MRHYLNSIFHFNSNSNASSDNIYHALIMQLIGKSVDLDFAFVQDPCFNYSFDTLILLVIAESVLFDTTQDMYTEISAPITIFLSTCSMR